MNCEKGDLAVVIKGAASGSIVHCINFYSEAIDVVSQKRITNAWHVKCRGTDKGRTGKPLCVCDSDLRPIRDPDGEDETMAWAGIPGRSHA